MSNKQPRNSGKLRRWFERRRATHENAREIQNRMEQQREAGGRRPGAGGGRSDGVGNMPGF